MITYEIGETGMKKRILSMILIGSMVLTWMPTIASAANSGPISTMQNRKVKIGDCIQLGSYYGSPLVWRCVAIDENGPLMLSDKILCLKAYDAKGNSDYHYVPGTYGSIRKQYGSNCYADSNIRQWLNSTETHISWTHDEPSTPNVLGGNAYNSESGFLSSTNFSAEERSYMKSITRKVYTNEAENIRGVTDGGSKEHIGVDGLMSAQNRDYTNCYYMYVTDTVFIPDLEQIVSVYYNLGNEYVKAYPTEQAVAHSDYSSGVFSSETPYKYWTTHAGTNGYSYEWVRFIAEDGTYTGSRAWDGAIGIRPAFYLNESAWNRGENNSPSNEIIFRSDDDFTVIIGNSTVILASIPKADELRQSDITWFSSNESVAIIESSAALIGDSLTSATAKIKGVSAGTTAIIVSLADGRSARCNVEVVIGPLTDTDGDGLYDIWEINGVDTDGDGVVDLHLEQMGADPNIPDIFVEVDWMVQPAEHFGFIQTREEVSLAPSADAMWLVYQSFKDHGINLHIDAGPDSIDFVTGESWGTLSGGTKIPYKEDFDIDKLWNQYIDTYFTANRKAVFRHAMFVNTYNGGTSSGVAKLAGQYLIVANQKWVRDTGNIGVAGSFMHELGHTLSLHHGGFAFDPERIPDAELNDKPNYLSVMNYLFQTSGLIGSGGVNYSEYTLPDLTESRLSEEDGIDPQGLTSGTGLGTKLVGSGTEIVPIAGAGIDFNSDGAIQSRETVVGVDLNNNGRTTDTLSGTNDWERIVYKAGTIGQLHSAGATMPEDKQSENINELTIEEALENGVLGRVGSGALEAIGPYTVPAGEYSQKIYIRVKNLSPEAVTFTLHMDSSPISSEYDGEVTLEPSIVSVSYVDIPLAILGTQSDGNYVIHATLSYSGKEVASINVPVTLHTLTSEDLDVLHDFIEEGTENLPDIVMNEYSDIFTINFIDVVPGVYYYDAVTWAIAQGITNGTTATTFSPDAPCTRGQIVTFLWRAAGSPSVSGNNPFNDVQPGDYWYDAVLWAVSKGITTGTSATMFSPNDSCTRGQTVTFLYRNADSPATTGATVFADVSLDAYYRNAVTWAVEENITNGTSTTTFSPEDQCTRGQIVTFLYRSMHK